MMKDDAMTVAAESVRSLVKLVLQSRHTPQPPRAPEGRPLVVMGNGPSLRGLIDSGALDGAEADLLAVNFAANAEEFYWLRPRYYVIADPHFFRSAEDPNVARLTESLRRKVDWDMTLFVPAGVSGQVMIDNPSVTVMPYNCVGVEGAWWLCRRAFAARRGMPRPRNVLIPSLMLGLWMGYRTIAVAGADHSWMRTLEVNGNNEVVSVQPHFYEEDEHETARVTAVYRGVRLHEVIGSFYVAFKAYHVIERWARSIGARIVNVTPGSFIDAFERGEPGDFL